MDLTDLKKIFLATGLVTVIAALCSALFSPEWAVRYAAIGVLALVNYVALAFIMVGALSKNVALVLAGFAFKPLLLGGLLVVIVQLGLEISSFLAGMNTFFLVLFAYMIFLGGAAKLRSTLASSLPKQDRANG